MKSKLAKKRNGATSRASTLADVAARAGVVPMTASRAINQSGYVSQEVQKRVMAAARHLQYRPNVIARQLRGSLLHAVGVILPDIANPFSAELMRGINEVLHEAGFNCFLGTTESSAQQELSVLQAFVDHRIDGLIIATQNTRIDHASIAATAKQGVPIVILGRPLKIRFVDCVTADDWQGAFDAVTYLAAAGHRRIGFIGCSSEDSYRPLRFVGFQDALKAAGLKLDPKHAVGSVVPPAWATEEDGFEGLMQLAKQQRPPTAVLARNDAAAIGALRAAHVLKLRVPQDVAIAGFDNTPAAAFQTPALTTVEQPTLEQGRVAARLLLERIRGNRLGPRKTVVMKCSLIVRESTDPNAGHAAAPRG